MDCNNRKASLPRPCSCRRRTRSHAVRSCQDRACCRRAVSRLLTSRFSISSAAARLGVSLGLEREKDRQPQARAGLAPGRQTFIKLLNPLVDLPLARHGPTVENPPARRPERKVVLGADRNDGAGIRSDILRAATEDIHHAAGMTYGVGERKRM